MVLASLSGIHQGAPAGWQDHGPLCSAWGPQHGDMSMVVSLSRASCTPSSQPDWAGVLLCHELRSFESVGSSWCNKSCRLVFLQK